MLGEHRIERDGQKREFSVLRQVLVRDVPGAVVGRELNTVGINLLLGPTLDVYLGRAKASAAKGIRMPALPMTSRSN